MYLIKKFTFEKIQYLLKCSITFLALCYAINLYSQENRIFSEAPIEVMDGIMLSNMVYVKFNDCVIDFPAGITTASLNDINPVFTHIVQFFENLETDYGSFTLYKAIPSAVWGENVTINRRTGKPVQLIDMSQLFIIGFAQMVPISQIIYDLEMLPEVAYAHQPIQARDLIEPNDPDYDDKQWNLEKIDAPKAWDITTGSSDVWVGIIEAHGVKRDHEDFFKSDQSSKFVSGKGDNTYDLDDAHGTMVAGIVGAATNNNKGIASLGWNIKMIPYHWTGWYPANMGNLPSKIVTAINDGVDILNLSFETLKLCDADNDCQIPADYQSVRDEILNALKSGIIVVAAVGNGNINVHDPRPNPGCCDTTLCPQGNVPYTPYPASYEFPGDNVEVIGVSATWSNDNFPGGYNHGDFVDVAAPGMGVWTTRHSTSGSSTYGYGSGTSMATPHVSALAGLILSINPDLTIQEVQEIIETTGEDLGDTGWDEYYGHGRINAHAAVLKALDGLPTRKSISSQATAYNGSRKLIKNGNNLYLVYESGNQIYFTKSTNNGNTWGDPPTRLSDGAGQNKNPSITGTSSKQFVVWQRYIGYSGGQHKYDIYFAKNTGSGWSTAKINNLSNLGFSTQTDPLPVVTYKTRSGGYRLLVCTKTSSAIKYVTSDNDGSSWSSVANVPSTSSSHQNPSLSMGPTTPASSVYLAYDNGSTIYYNTYTTSWGSAQNVSSGSGTVNNRYPSVEVDGNSGKNFAWQGYSNPLLLWVVVHRRNSGSFKIFTTKGDGGSYPSITGHTTNKRSIVYTTDGGNEVYRAYYNESSWSGQFVDSNSRHPNISAGTTTARYVWTRGSNSPYEIKLSGEELPSDGLLKLASAGEMGEQKLQTKESSFVYHRSSVLEDTLSSTLLWIEWGELTVKNRTGEQFPLELVTYDDDNLKLTSDTLFDYLESEPFQLPADVDSISWQQNFYGLGMNNLVAEASNDMNVEIQLVDASTKSILTSLSQVTFPNSSSEIRFQGLITKNIADYKGKEVVLRVVVTGLADNRGSVIPGLVEVFISTGSGLFKKDQDYEGYSKANQNPFTFRLEQNYPNPFNPETIIKYAVLIEGYVTLKIYNTLGQEIKTLVDDNVSAGSHTIQWDGRDRFGNAAASGIYILRLIAGQKTVTGKMLLVR